MGLGEMGQNRKKTILTKLKFSHEIFSHCRVLLHKIKIKIKIK